MTTIQAIIAQRRSIYPASYTGKPIDKKTLYRLLECANHAPTHKLTQPWRFTVFVGDGLGRLAEELSRLYRENTPKEQYSDKKYTSIQDKVRQSAAVLAICVHFSDKIPRQEEIISVACAVQNIWLAASAEGIGSYWSTPAYSEKLNSFLNLSEDTACIGLFYMGYHNEPLRESKRSPIDEKLIWED